ncbi:MAG: penicillin-binding protein [Clostridia bacterium]|nr:penicillin-binding protein [Clostridia bacterium]
MTFRKPAWLDRGREILAEQKRRGVFALIGRILLTIGLIFVLTACIVACVLTVYVATNFTGQSNLPDVDSINENQTSIIMTLNESTGEYEEFQRLSGIKRIWTPLGDMPVNMQNAIVAIEDERFNTHFGVDWKRTISAFANLILHFNQTEYGGSTLTQQLIKVMTGNNDHSIQRKITEILSAVEMEKYYSKDEILQAYLNMMPLASNVTGVGAGANYFFGVEAKDLTLAQCAALAAMTNNPVKYNPYRYPENLRTRQRLVLYKMYELDFITADEYKQALGEELYFKSSAKTTEVNDWYTDMLIDDVTFALVKKYGYTEAQARNMVFYGGLTIYSCENPKLQAKVEAIYRNDDNFPKALLSDTVQPQAAIYVMDYTGKTVAVVGGRGEKEGDRLFNRAISAIRQPGSSMKPIAVYAPAIQLNLINYSSPVRDCYIVLKDGTKWPTNVNQSTPQDSGMTTVDVAVQTSKNTVAAQLVEQLTPHRSFTFLTGSLNFTSLVTSDANGNTDIDYAPMALGGLTNGAYPREMAAAYQIFGNGGSYNEPYSFVKVTQKGNTILQDGPAPIQVLDEDSAYIMNRLLQTVVTGTEGATASSLKNAWSNWEVFAKTGTTQKRNDVWLVGGTPKYVAASWFGYDKNQVLVGSQTSAARNLWSKTMLALHEGVEPTPFDRRGTTVEQTFCTETGLLATEKCPKTRVGVYKPNYMPDMCDKHSVPAEGGTVPEAQP